MSRCSSRTQRFAAEFVGTAALVAAVIGSGISASRLAPAQPALQLLLNALATAAALYVIIAVLASVSGAQLNPVVSAALAARGHISPRNALLHAAAQLIGAASGAVLANLMFGIAPISIASAQRLSLATALAEVAATAGLIVIVVGLVERDRAGAVPAVVAAYIGAAYFATSSTAFANPAATLARVLSDSFAGIAPVAALGFVAAQLVGAAIGLAAARVIFGKIGS